jgi:L-aspartate oxidase
MTEVHPDAELAPRDVVARAIAAQMARQDGRPVLLDATGLGDGRAASFLGRRFPTIDAAVRARGMDWSREPIPVTPAAHYLMGGVTADLRGRTSLPGLYAVGEVARTGVHGANRLASNSLLEGAVFGARAGDVLVPDAESGRWPVAAAARTLPTANHGDEHRDESRAPFARADLQELMWADAGLVRDAAGLKRAAAAIAGWRAAPHAAATTADFEDENLLLVAQEVVAAALARTGSVGAHFRSDGAAPTTPELPADAADRVARSRPPAPILRSSAHPSPRKVPA